MATVGATKMNAKKTKWALDYSNRTKSDRLELPSPPGFSPQVATAVAEGNKETDASLLLKRSWDVALQPLKQVPMNLFIMYMAGNSISIFPIMMVGMMLVRPVRALFGMSQVFKALDGQHAIGQRLVYMLGQLVGIGLALWKCQSMGLLPTHASDWLDFVEPQQRVEYSDGGISIL